jgi:hypothetical protein
VWATVLLQLSITSVLVRGFLTRVAQSRSAGSTPGNSLDVGNRLLDSPANSQRDLRNAAFDLAVAVGAKQHAPSHFAVELVPASRVTRSDVETLRARIEVMESQRPDVLAIPAHLARTTELSHKCFLVSLFETTPIRAT